MGERFVKINAISAQGVIDCTRGITRKLPQYAQTTTDTSRETAYIQLPKDAPLVFGQVYEVKQFGAVVGQALCEEGPEKTVNWRVQRLFEQVPSGPER